MIRVMGAAKSSPWSRFRAIAVWCYCLKIVMGLVVSAFLDTASVDQIEALLWGAQILGTGVLVWVLTVASESEHQPARPGMAQAVSIARHWLTLEWIVGGLLGVLMVHAHSISFTLLFGATSVGINIQVLSVILTSMCTAES